MIDDHAHPFPLQYEPLRPWDVALDIATGAAAQGRRKQLAPGRLYQELLLARLSRYLNVPPTADVVVARNERAQHDWAGWVSGLLDDAGITGVVMDEALLPIEPGGAAEIAAVAGRDVWHMTRIDPLVDHLLESGASASEVVDAVESAMQEASAGGCVAYKTVLAYRTGLAVDPTAHLRAAQRELTAQKDVPVRRRGKILRDLVTRRMLGIAADLAKPVQFHTGMGDSEIRLAESHPLLLEQLLGTPEGTKAQIVLIHGSFPWQDPAAYLAATRPNVWLELSLANLFAPLGTTDRLVAALDVAPSGRILLGTDGHGPPETHWFAAHVLADAWSSAAERLSAAGATPGWVASTHDDLFEDNARRLYDLDAAQPAGSVASGGPTATGTPQ